MILYRCCAWDAGAGDAAPDGALWVPRIYQGDGRHDNPDLYGCLYLAEHPSSCVVEQLARFRGHPLRPSMLMRRGLPLGLAEVHLEDDSAVVDLDDPDTLRRLRLRPSRVATRQRDTTQRDARALYERRATAAGIRWWSTFESLWINVTLFDRAAPRLRLVSVRPLDVNDAMVTGAARFLGL